MGWLDQVWKKNVWNPVKNTVNPEKMVLPNPPGMQESLQNNPEYNALYESKKKALAGLEGLDPRGYDDESIASLRKSMDADRNFRREDATFRTKENSIDLGRADSSMTRRDLRDLETGFEREANMSDSQLLMAEDDAIKKDRAYIDSLKSKITGEMMDISGQATNTDMLKYNRDVQQAQIDNENANRNNKLFTDLVGLWGGNLLAKKSLAKNKQFF